MNSIEMLIDSLRHRPVATTATQMREAADALDRLEAQLREARKALASVRENLHCTKLFPHEYDADHRCGECGSSSAWAKDVIDEFLAATEPKP